MEIIAKTPCHGSTVKLIAHDPIPRERYDRSCPTCRYCWTIERRFNTSGNGYRVDVLDWFSSEHLYDQTTHAINGKVA